MASVLYRCPCNLEFSLQDLYYCQHCKAARCNLCVEEEIEVHFCPNCLEPLPAPEAGLFVNRCSKCFECPICFSTLQTLVAENQYFLACGFCQWNSRSIGFVSDKHEGLILNNLKREREAGTERQVAALIEQFQADFSVNGSGVGGKTRVRSSRISEGSRLTSSSPSTRRTSSLMQQELLAAPRTSCGIQAGHIDGSIALISTSVAQRHLNTGESPMLLKDIWPRRKQLHSKRSKRCGVCERIVVKPEANPLSMAFTMNKCARAFFPRVVAVELRGGGGTEVLLHVVNPVDKIVKVSFETVTEEGLIEAKAVGNGIVMLGAYNDLDAPWVDEAADHQLQEDTSGFVVNRQGNSATLKFNIFLSSSSSSKFGLRMSIVGDQVPAASDPSIIMLITL